MMARVGWAIKSRTFIGPETLQRGEYCSPVRDLVPLEAVVSVTVPLVRDDLALGAISVEQDRTGWWPLNQTPRPARASPYRGWWFKR